MGEKQEYFFLQYRFNLNNPREKAFADLMIGYRNQGYNLKELLLSTFVRTPDVTHNEEK